MTAPGPRIARTDVIAALESLGITDVANVVHVNVTPGAVVVTRAVRTPDGGILLDMLRDDIATTTTRIEIV